jgi:hypothetical protein
VGVEGTGAGAGDSEGSTFVSYRIEETRKTIAELAAEGFANHVAIPEGPGEWLCRAPDRSHRWFRIIIRPCTVIVWGDIGDWILTHSDGDSLGWLSRAAKDAKYPGYLLSKIRAGKDREFYAGDARAWLDEQVADGVEDAAKVKEWLEESTGLASFDQHQWYSAWYETGTGGRDIPDFLDYGSGPLWLGQAMSWFVAHLPAQDAAGADEGASL